MKINFILILIFLGIIKNKRLLESFKILNDENIFSNDFYEFINHYNYHGDIYSDNDKNQYQLFNSTIFIFHQFSSNCNEMKNIFAGKLVGHNLICVKYSDSIFSNIESILENVKLIFNNIKNNGLLNDQNEYYSLGLSQGGIIARAFFTEYFKEFGEYITKFVTIGTPNIGSYEFHQSIITTWASNLTTARDYKISQDFDFKKLDSNLFINKLNGLTKNIKYNNKIKYFLNNLKIFVCFKNLKDKVISPPESAIFEFHNKKLYHILKNPFNILYSDSRLILLDGSNNHAGINENCFNQLDNIFDIENNFENNDDLSNKENIKNKKNIINDIY